MILNWPAVLMTYLCLLVIQILLELIQSATQKLL